MYTGPPGEDPLQFFQGRPRVAPADLVEERVDALGFLVLDVGAHVGGADAAALARPAEELRELRGEDLRPRVGQPQQRLDRVRLERDLPLAGPG